MNQHSYYSDRTNKNTSLADATWEEFGKYLSKYQWAFDHPSASPRKSEISHALTHQGEKGCCTFQREGGWKYVLKRLGSWAFQQAVSRHRKIYYVSYGRTLLLYFDVDLHQVFQQISDGLAAVESLNRTKLPIYWIDSNRGFNGYVKVELSDCTFEEANKIIDRLEKALRRALALEENLVDFEIKGRVGYLKDGEYDWSSYGKLPIHNPKWSWSELKKFSETPAVGIKRLEKLATYIEANVPNSVLERNEARKKDLRSQPRIENGHFLLTDELKAKLEQRGVLRQAMFEANVDGDWGEDRTYWIPVEFLEMMETPAETEIQNSDDIHAEKLPSTPPPSLPTKTPVTKIFTDDLNNEPDSFARQREALLRLSRSLRRVPKLEEALAYIQTNGLFTGTWDDNFQRRKKRVKSTLKFIVQTFDPAKCSKGSVNVGKFNAWAKKKFPNGILSDKKRWVTPDGEIVEIKQQIHVGPAFIGIFTAICEFGLLVDKNEDDSLPHRRAKEVWDALYVKNLVSEPFNDRKWAVCREELVERNIVQITDRNFCPGKAMRWTVGQFFPLLGLWKTKKTSSLLEPVNRIEFLEMKLIETKEIHNTLLRKRPLKMDAREAIVGSRPPP